MSKELKARSVELAKSAKNIGREIHIHLLAIARHIADEKNNKDVTLATHFYNLLSMKNGDGNSESVIRAEAVKLWLTTFAFCKFGKQKDGREGFLHDAKKRAAMGDDHFRLAAATPFYKLVKEKQAEKPWDFDAAFKQLVLRANEKALERTDTGEVKNKVPAEHLAKAKALATEFGIEL